MKRKRIFLLPLPQLLLLVINRQGGQPHDSLSSFPFPVFFFLSVVDLRHVGIGTTWHGAALSVPFRSETKYEHEKKNVYLGKKRKRRRRRRDETILVVLCLIVDQMSTLARERIKEEIWREDFHDK
jgi:hypothetical protein